MKSFLFSLFFLSLTSLFAQNASTITACNPKAICAVDDYALSQVKGKLPLPEVKPEYEGGNKALLAHFAPNEYPSAEPFTVSIGFLINCKAQAGNYQILTKHSEDTKFVADLVMAQVAELPAKWQPGKSRSRFIDCYQVIQVMIQDGKVVKVGLK